MEVYLYFWSNFKSIYYLLFSINEIHFLHQLLIGQGFAPQQVCDDPS